MHGTQIGPCLQEPHHSSRPGPSVPRVVEWRMTPWKYIVVVASVCLFAIREWSWASWKSARVREIESLQNDKIALQKELVAEIDMFNKFIVAISDEDSAALQQCNVSLVRAVPVIDSPSSADQKLSLLSWSSVAQLTICVSLLLGEVIGLYGISDPSMDSDRVYDKVLDASIKMFLSKHHPLSSMLLSVAVWTITWLPTVGILSSTTAAKSIFVLITMFLLSSWICFVSCNIWQLRRYLPKTWDELKEKTRDRDWWLWFLSRTFGCYDVTSAKSMLLWAFGAFWIFWSVRHFVVNSATCCSEVSSAIYFLLWNVAQLSLLTATMYLFYVSVIILPSLEDLKSVDDDLLWKRVLVRCLRLLLPALRWTLRPKSVAVLVFLSVVNSLIALFRLFLFLWSGGLTMYSWFVSWMFINLHIAFSITALQAISILLWMDAVRSSCRDPFIKQYVSAVADSPEQQESTQQTVEATFDDCLIRSAVYCLFMNVEDDQEESELKGNKVYKVFRAILEMDLHDIANAHDNDVSPTGAEKEHES